MKTKFSLTTAVIALLFVSCKKEIQLDLNEKDSHVVIEGSIKNDDLPAEITITRTSPFNSVNSFPAVVEAEVTLSDNAGNSELLTEIAPGRYRGVTLRGIEGRTYHLLVKTSGETFTAESTLPKQVRFDTLVGREEAFLGRHVYNLYPLFEDPGSARNQYRFVLYRNGVRLPGSTVWDDAFTDGKYNFQPITTDISLVENGDKIDVEMQSIDRAIFKYFDSMAHTNMGSAAPSNPVSNIKGGALGYFSAHTIQRRSIMVKKN